MRRWFLFVQVSSTRPVLIRLVGSLVTHLSSRSVRTEYEVSQPEAPSVCIPDRAPPLIGWRRSPNDKPASRDGGQRVARIENDLDTMEASCLQALSAGDVKD